MIRALDMMYKTFGKSMRRTHSIFVEKVIKQDLQNRKNSTRIRNVKLKKNLYWPMNVELPQSMKDQGWEYGMYLTDEQL